MLEVKFAIVRLKSLMKVASKEMGNTKSFHGGQLQVIE